MRNYKKVLVVENDKCISFNFEELFRKNEFLTSSTSSFENALDILQIEKKDYDIVFISFERGGLELAKYNFLNDLCKECRK